MKAISLWQPWASLIVLGVKRYETRSWSTNIRGTIAIHASKKIVPFREAFGNQPEAIQGFIWDRLIRFYGSTKDLPAGVILGAVNLADVFETEFIASGLPPIERACGDYSPGRYAWKLTGVECFVKPIPATGHQGFWEWK